MARGSNGRNGSSVLESHVAVEVVYDADKCIPVFVREAFQKVQRDSPETVLDRSADLVSERRQLKTAAPPVVRIRSAQNEIFVHEDLQRRGDRLDRAVQRLCEIVRMDPQLCFFFSCTDEEDRSFLPTGQRVDDLHVFLPKNLRTGLGAAIVHDLKEFQKRFFGRFEQFVFDGFVGHFFLRRRSLPVWNGLDDRG